jgi:hypothetical protein
MVEVNIKLPDEVALALGNGTEAVTRRIMENAAIENYRAGRLSQRQVGEMLGLNYWQTEGGAGRNSCGCRIPGRFRETIYAYQQPSANLRTPHPNPMASQARHDLVSP